MAEQTNSAAGDDTVLRDLEQEVRAELALAEGSAPDAAARLPIEEWLFDPVDVERAEVGLRSLLGAVEAAEAPPAPHGSHLVARDHCLSLVRAVDRPTGAARYGRMFPGLDPLATDPQLLVRAGDKGEICDAAAFIDPGRSGAAPADDAAEAAGWPFFGQLIAHDITADRSPIGAGVDPGALRNARSPRLDLEMVYADGPIGAPYLFDVADPARFLLGPGGVDVPRNPQGVALIGDPRNDVHLFVLALHTALLRAHNRVVALLRADGVPEAEVFDRARVTLTWHYQWVVGHDFLPRLDGPELVEQVLVEGGRWFAPASGRRSSRWSSPTPPSATATARSATPTGCVPTAPRYRCSPTWSGSDRCHPSGAWTWPRSSTCPDDPRAARQAPRRPARRQPHRVARAGHRRGRRGRVPVPRGSRPAARPEHRAAQR